MSTAKTIVKSPIKAATPKPSPKKTAAKTKPVNALGQSAAPNRAKNATPAPKRKPVQSAKTAVKQPAVPVTGKVSQTQTAQPKALDKKASDLPSKTIKEKKVKVVRDSFTLPKTELLQIGEMKKRAMTLGVEVKKSELIRAGLQALVGMTDTAFKKAMANVPTIKTGRPSKD
jgi:hypothetical protein